MRSGAIALVVTASLAVLLLGNSSIAGAHNSLDSSAPESGATLAVAPTVVELNFKKDVPLESFSSALTGPDGTRTPLAGAIGGQATQVNVRLPNLTAGEYSLRWKLVSSDGHAITDTVQFNVQGAQSTTTAQQTAPPATNGANLDGGLTTSGASGASGVTGTPAAVSPSGASGLPDANSQPTTDRVNPAAVGGFKMPGPLGWGLRALGYGLFAVLVGGLVTGARLWPQRWSEPTSGRSDIASKRIRSTDSGTANLKLVTGYAAAALGAVAAIAALVSAGDIVGQRRGPPSTTCGAPPVTGRSRARSGAVSPARCSPARF